MALLAASMILFCFTPILACRFMIWFLFFQVYTPPPPPPIVTIDVTNVTHTVNPKFMGCHLGALQRARELNAVVVWQAT